MRPCLFVAASGVLWLGVAGVARAAGDDRAVAETLFQKGRTALANKDLATACAAFEESERLEAAPGTMYNLGDCEEKRGHLSSAWQWFGEALTKLPAKDERRPVVERREKALRARLPFLTIRLAPGAPPETQIAADATVLGAASLGVALPFDPGRHHVVASAAHYEDQGFDVVLVEGQQKELVVSPGAAAPVAAPPPPPPVVVPPPVHEAPPESNPQQPTQSHDTKTLGFVIGGVGVAGIGTGLILGAVAIGKKNTVNHDCHPAQNTCDDQSGIDASSSGSTFATLSTVSVIVGAAAVGVGAYFVLTSKKDEKTVVGAAPSPGGGFMTLAREF